MKRTLATLAAISTIVTLSACGSSTPPKTPAQAFVSAFNDLSASRNGMQVTTATDKATLISAGHTLCSDMSHGVLLTTAEHHLSSVGITDDTMQQFIGTAAVDSHSLCPLKQ